MKTALEEIIEHVGGEWTVEPCDALESIHQSILDESFKNRFVLKEKPLPPEIFC